MSGGSFSKICEKLGDPLKKESFTTRGSIISPRMLQKDPLKLVPSQKDTLIKDTVYQLKSCPRSVPNTHGRCSESSVAELEYQGHRRTKSRACVWPSLRAEAFCHLGSELKFALCLVKFTLSLLLIILGNAQPLLVRVQFGRLQVLDICCHFSRKT